MPAAGAAVMDAFKNLIRHGKHAKAPPNVSTEPQAPRAQAHQSYPPAAPRAADNTTREAAEILVQEEREASKKMPHYAGLERYTLIDKMGDGAFSKVYKAVDKTTGEKVAIKVVRKYELSASQDGNKHLNPQFKKRPRVTERANILKEVQIMRGTDHPAVVKLISFSESDEHYFLVLELLEGGELFHQIVKLTYFSEPLARHVILQVARGIRYLHEERGVVHRDIKPENLLFERIPIIPTRSPQPNKYDEQKEDEGEFRAGIGGGGIGGVKIADFGLSKVVWNEETMTPCGTVGYTAPEIVKDERYSKSVDMWALGCVLYTLLCGFPPFYDESINVLTEKVARGYYTFLSPWWDEISESAKELITHLLCVDPAQRYTIDEFLAHPWCLEQDAPPTPTPTNVQPPEIPQGSAWQQSFRGPRDGRSPGVATLKETFDITYAVHRMEEEGARRRAYNGPGGAGVRGFLGGLNEDDEDSDGVSEASKKHGANVGSALAQKKAQQQGQVPPAGPKNVYDGRAGTRDVWRQGGFNLDLDNATLLGRRHKRGYEGSPLVIPAVQPQQVR